MKKKRSQENVQKQPLSSLTVIWELIEKEQYPEALECALQARDRFDRNLRVRRALSQTLYLNGKPEEALAELETARDLGLAEAAFLKDSIPLLVDLGEMDRLVKTCTALIETHGNRTSRVFDNLALAHVSLRDWDAAIAAADERLRINKNDTRAIMRKYDAIVSKPDVEQIIQEIEDWFFGELGTPKLARFFNKLPLNSKEFGPAWRKLAERALREWPEDETVASLLARFRIGDGRGAVNTPAIGRQPKLVEKLDGDLQRDFGFKAASQRLELLRHCLHRDIREDELKRAPIATDEGADVIITEPGPAGIAAMVFTARGGGFFGPVSLFDAYLAREGIGAIYLRDWSQLFYLNGIESLGKGFEASREKLVEVAGSMTEGKSLTLLGASAGGFGALRYAPALGASRVVGFSAITNATDQFMENNKDRRGRFILGRLNTLLPTAPRSMRDNLAAAEVGFEVDLIFGAGQQHDRAHAQDLAGLQGVELFPMGGFSSHASLDPVIEQDQLGNVLLGRMKGLRAARQGR